MTSRRSTVNNIIYNMTYDDTAGQPTIFIALIQIQNRTTIQPNNMIRRRVIPFYRHFAGHRLSKSSRSCAEEPELVVASSSSSSWQSMNITSTSTRYLTSSSNNPVDGRDVNVHTSSGTIGGNSSSISSGMENTSTCAYSSDKLDSIETFMKEGHGIRTSKPKQNTNAELKTCSESNDRSRGKIRFDN